MIILLNTFYIVLSILYLVGRIYEIVMITDPSTGFLTTQGIVSTPVMMLILCLIAVCCGVIIFSTEKFTGKALKFPVGIWGMASGVFFVIGGIASSLDCFKYGGFIGYHIAEVLGGIGLAMLGLYNVKGKKRELVPSVAVILLAAGTCLNSVIYEIKTIQNTDYLMRSLAGLFTLIFFILLFKNAYSPRKGSLMLLYIACLANFVFTGCGSIAAVLGIFAGSKAAFGQIMYNAGYAVIGAFSLLIALYISPENIAVEEEETVKIAPVVRKERKVKEVPAPQPAQMWTEEVYKTDNIDRRVIEELFARKEAKENADRYVPEQQEKTVVQPVQRTVAAEKTVKNVSETIVMPKEKSTFKSTGKKPAQTKKVVYKAPK